MTQEQTTLVTLDGRPCVVPDVARFARLAQLANSYWCPLGPAVGRAWVLLLRGDLDKIRSSGQTFHELVFQVNRNAKQQARVALGQLLLVQTQRITPGKTDDADSLHLVELADKRWLVDRFSDSGNRQFNIRSFAQSDDYLEGSGGYTWSSAVESIWNTMSSTLGSFPGLPAAYTPHGVPENLRFTGVNAWRALNRVLEKIGCTIAYHPIDQTFSIVLLGSQQIDLPEEIAGGEKLLDAEPLEDDAANFPETIRVYFHTHYRSFGQQRDTELTTNWSLAGHSASIDVPSGVAGAQSGTILPLWDDLPNLLNENNAPANALDLQNRAEQRAANWIADQQTSGRRRLQIYPGVVTDVLPGSQVKVVLWRAWGPSAGGTATEIVTHPGLPTRVTGGGDAGGGVVWDEQIFSRENFGPPDLARRSFPNYPRLANIVQVYDSQQSGGDIIQANADGLHSGRVRRWVAGQMATLDDCWIRFVDDHDSKAGSIPATNFDFYGPARLSGIETSQGVTRPIYLTRRNDIQGVVPFCLTATLVPNGTAAATNQDSLQAITVQDDSPAPGQFRGVSGYCGWARYDTSTQNYFIIAITQIAHLICVTLTENMGATQADESQGATVGTYWDGQNPGATATIYTRCGIAANALSGQQIIAVYDLVADQYIAAFQPPDLTVTNDICGVLGGDTHADTVTAVNSLRFSKTSGIDVVSNPGINTTRASVQIKKAGNHHVMSTIAGNTEVVQTATPRASHFTAVGEISGFEHGWFRSQAANGTDVYRGSGRGIGKLYIRTTNSGGQSTGSFRYVISRAAATGGGVVVEEGWAKGLRSKSGTKIKLSDGTDTYEWEFLAGSVITSTQPDMEAHAAEASITATDITDDVHDFCP